MTTAAASNSAHELYDPDAVVPQNSPLLVPKKVTFRPSRSPSLELARVQVSPSPDPDDRKTKRRPKVRPSQGDAVLIAIMDNGRHPDIASHAGQQALPSDSEEGYSSGPETDSSDDEMEAMTMSNEFRAGSAGQYAQSISRKGNILHDDLQTLAGKTLAALALEASGDERRASTTNRTTGTGASRPPESSPPPATAPRPEHDIRKDDKPQPLVPPPYSPPGYFSSSMPFASPTGSLAGHGELPPIQSTSPRSDSNCGMSLPSIRDQLGPEALSPSSYPNSPPRIPSFSSQTSSPISPHEIYPRDHRSPHIIGSLNSYYSFNPNGIPHRASIDHNGSTPSSTDQSASTPATSIHSVADRMSLDGMAFSNPEIGQFVCKYDGCKAPPFHTQYLLNSHANVHSQSRPHYCPVKGCSRSEGGKGFKRKNEMIRHGLVHDSPGYVCPFCPDREHRYPRPDNLQRHVRVHHVDKDKDDPLLRDVLSQRPDGPSRGRRRRGGPM